MRPELERKAEDLKDVAAHAASRFLGVSDKSRQLVEAVDLVGGVCSDERESAINGVAVRVDEAGE